MRHSRLTRLWRISSGYAARMPNPPILEAVTLEGHRARLTPLRREDIDALWAAQDADTWRWTLAQPKTREEFASVVETALELSESGRERAWTTWYDGVIVGSTRFLNASEWDRRVEIGWTWLGPAARGTAINPTVKLLQLTHAFEDRGCVRVELKTDGRNVRSQRAMEKLGCTREGLFRKHRRQYSGEVHDTAWYSIIDTEWPAVKARLLERIGHG